VRRAPNVKLPRGSSMKHIRNGAKKSGEAPLVKREFGQRLADRGVEEGRDKKRRFWKGLEVAKGDVT